MITAHDGPCLERYHRQGCTCYCTELQDCDRYIGCVNIPVKPHAIWKRTYDLAIQCREKCNGTSYQNGDIYFKDVLIVQVTYLALINKLLFTIFFRKHYLSLFVLASRVFPMKNKWVLFFLTKNTKDQSKMLIRKWYYLTDLTGT